MSTHRTEQELRGILSELCKLPRETDWVEFKHNNAEPDEVGEYRFSHHPGCPGGKADCSIRRRSRTQVHEIPAGVGQMSASNLFDGCLTGPASTKDWSRQKSSTFNALYMYGLFDRCLTGVAMRSAQALCDVPAKARRRSATSQPDRGMGGLGKLGDAINFNRVFFQYQPPRPLHEIDAELAGVEQRVMELLREVTE